MLQRDRAEIVSPRGCYAFFMDSRTRPSKLNKVKPKKRKKKRKKECTVKVLFSSAMALCFARLSLTLSFVVARKGKGAALFRTTRVIIFRV